MSLAGYLLVFLLSFASNASIKDIQGWANCPDPGSPLSDLNNLCHAAGNYNVTDAVNPQTWTDESGVLYAPTGTGCRMQKRPMSIGTWLKLLKNKDEALPGLAGNYERISDEGRIVDFFKRNRKKINSGKASEDIHKFLAGKNSFAFYKRSKGTETISFVTNGPGKSEENGKLENIDLIFITAFQFKMPKSNSRLPQDSSAAAGEESSE